jgi:uncharacterized repeat protein (TIGR03803 family)
MANPEYAPPIQNTNGMIYGATMQGGMLNCPPPYGCGTVDEVAPPDSLRSIEDGFSGLNGGFPQAGLVQLAAGAMSGTTSNGGVGQGQSCGVVFGINASGEQETLHNFNGPPTDGCTPLATILAASKGQLYGTTLGGGREGGGTVFQLTPTGIVSIVYSFCTQSGWGDGSGP